jgi:hypothetical protein
MEKFFTIAYGKVIAVRQKLQVYRGTAFLTCLCWFFTPILLIHFHLEMTKQKQTKENPLFPATSLGSFYSK